LDEIEKLGVKTVAISVDSPEESRDLCKKAGFTFPFLSDPNTTAIRAYDLLHKGAGVNGHDVAALSCVGFITTFQRGTEWAATGKVTQKVPADFPTSEHTSIRQ
jgi:hypothetical protein